jgi:hypothetical protein
MRLGGSLLRGATARPSITRPLLVGLVGLSVVTGLLFIEMTGLFRGDSSYIGIDGMRLLDASRSWMQGGDPYANPLFVYAPPSLILAAPLAAIGDVPGLIALAGVGVVLAVVAVLKETRTRVAAILGIIGLVAFWPFLADLLIGNVTIELSFAMWLVVRGDRRLHGIPLGVLGAAAPKPMLLPFLVWALVWRRRPAVGVAVAGLVAAVAGAVVTGPGRYIDWVRSLTAGSVPIEFAGNHSISVVSPILGFIAAGVFVLAFVLVLQTRGPILALVWSLGTGILVSPYAGDYALLPMVVGWPALAGIAPLLAISAAAAGMVGGVLFYPIVALFLLVLLLVPPAIEGPAFDRSDRTIGAVPERTSGG